MNVMRRVKPAALVCCLFLLIVPCSFAGNGDGVYVFDNLNEFIDSIQAFILENERTREDFGEVLFLLRETPDDDRFFNLVSGPNGIEYPVNFNVFEGGEIVDVRSFNSALELVEFVEELFGGAVPAAIKEDLEELKKAAEKAKQAGTGSILTEIPGGPLDEVFSQVALGSSVFSRPFADISPTGTSDTGADAGAAEGAETQAVLSDLIAGQLRYTRFDFNGVDGNVYGVTLGAVREQESIRYGIIIPYDRVDYDGTSDDADSFTFTPFVQWIPMRQPVMILIGPYLIYNYTFIHDTENFSMWGAGFSGSLEKRFEPIWVRIGAATEYIDADIDVDVDNVVRFRYGGTVGFPLVAEKVEGRIFAIGTVTDEEFLGGDSTFGTLGAEIAANINEAFALTFGYMSSVGHSELSSHTGYIGGILALR